MPDNIMLIFGFWLSGGNTGRAGAPSGRDKWHWRRQVGRARDFVNAINEKNLIGKS